jgi:formylglycine-generating enzyme required for sulfatase activity
MVLGLVWCVFECDPQTDPRGSGTGSDRVFRGGSWFLNAIGGRSAYRFYGSPDYWLNFFGFRVVLAPGQP